MPPGAFRYATGFFSRFNAAKVLRQLMAATSSPEASPWASAVASDEMKRNWPASSRSLACTRVQSASFIV